MHFSLSFQFEEVDKVITNGIGNNEIRKKHLHFRNATGNTWLHEAATNGNVESTKQIIERRKKEGEYSKDVTQLNTYKESFLHSAMRSTKIPKHKVPTYIDSVDNEAVKFILDIEETKAEPLLHVAIKHDYYQSVDKIKKAAGSEYVTLVNKPNDNEEYPIHVAAKLKKFATLKRIVKTFKGINLDARDKHKNTVLHIAMKQGDEEAVGFLIREGCDLAARNNEGNTPLHCLVEQAALACDDKKRLEPHLKVWQKVIAEVLHWWFKTKNGPQYTTHMSTQIKRDALYYLRSELTNNDGLSVIQYAAQEGVTQLVRDMIWVEDIFIIPEEKQKVWKHPDLVTVNVTNLMPHVTSKEVKYWKGGIDENTRWQNFKYMGDEMVERQDGKSVKLFDHWDVSFSENDKTLITPFIRIKPPNKAAEIMNIQPLKQLVRDHWFVCQWFTVVIMVAHLMHMVFYTNYCTDITLAAFKPNISGQASVDPNYLYIIWPSMLIISEFVSMCYVIGYVLWTLNAGRRFSFRHVLKLIHQKFEQDVEDYIDIKDVFKWPSFILSLIASVLRFVLVWLFFALTLSALIHTSDDVSKEFNKLILSSVFVGWIMTFYWARSFEPVYRFTTAFYVMIIKDMISWVLFFILVLLAFSSAFYMIFQTVPDLDPDLPWDHFPFVLYDFLLKGCRFPTKISSEDISEKMNQAGMNTFPFEFLYTIYAIIMGMFFYGMLTSTMIGTYSEFKKTNKNGWRQNSLALNKSWLTDLIAEHILHPFFRTINITSRTIYRSPNSGHYYITMSKKEKNEYIKSFRLMKSSLDKYDWPEMNTDNDITGTDDKGSETDKRNTNSNDNKTYGYIVPDTENWLSGLQPKTDENYNVHGESIRSDRMRQSSPNEDKSKDRSDAIENDNADTDNQEEYNTPVGSPPDPPNPLRQEQCSMT